MAPPQPFWCQLQSQDGGIVKFLSEDKVFFIPGSLIPAAGHVTGGSYLLHQVLCLLKMFEEPPPLPTMSLELVCPPGRLGSPPLPHYTGLPGTGTDVQEVVRE